ncbi:succinylglutamate desuccinylase [Desulfosarcina alkanivorans]|uniref:Succinylglutamate desuccinylase n=1 Tax=Desulfosarcina alkanivorans TaxID=571177 RepID=A0A5K7YAU6_9BACT|nr:M14 family metallopeptidase [Desulfosarcina alkanivorans]BBO66278.1 succinylglutamate desuccinylase [Desulfosarcina alkanivorans]
MSNNIQFDLQELISERSTKKHGFIDIAQKVDGSMVRIPYFIICGKDEGPLLLVDACNHGDEYEGSEGIIQALNELNPEQVKGTLVGIPALNLEAFNAGMRIAPIDWSYQDLNRAYPGNEKGLITSRIAHFYMHNFIRKADYVISFHGGGNSLYLDPLAAYLPPDTEVGKVTYEMAKAFGVKVLWRQQNLPFSGITTVEAQKFGVPAIIPEIGGHCVRHEHRQYYVDICSNGIKNVMVRFGMLQGKVPTVADQIDVELRYLHTDQGGIHKPLKKALDECREGEVLSEVHNLFGEKVGEVVAPFDGVIIGYWCYTTIHPGNWAFLYGKHI